MQPAQTDVSVHFEVNTDPNVYANVASSSDSLSEVYTSQQLMKLQDQEQSLEDQFEVCLVEK